MYVSGYHAEIRGTGIEKERTGRERVGGARQSGGVARIDRLNRKSWMEIRMEGARWEKWKEGNR